MSALGGESTNTGSGEQLAGLHHLSLTVSDLERSVPFYVDLLGFAKVGEQFHDDGRTVVLALAEGPVVLLLQEHKAHEGSTFSEFRPGLDHLSFRVAGEDLLDRWRECFDENGVDHQSIRHEDFGVVLIFRDPDRIQLELYVDPPA